MNKQLKILAFLPLIALASCDVGGNNSFYGNTFTYQSSVSYNLSSDNNNLGVALDSLIKDQMSQDNIDWTKSGYVNDFLFLSVVTPFASHDTYENLVTGMEKDAKTTFDKNYYDFKLVFGTFAEKTATLTYKGETKNLTIKAYGEDKEDASYLYLYEAGKESESIGYFDVAPFNGNGWSNGKLKCAEVSLDFISRLKCTVTWKNPVKETSSISWYVYATIAN